MANCTPVATPLSLKVHFKLASSEEHSMVSSYPFLGAIGSLMYAALGTCPDICSAVQALAPFAATFGQSHIKGIKHIMCYLAGSSDHGIMYTMGGGDLIGYTDADWANDLANHCSISGYAFLYSGGAISWMSKQQSTTVTSSTHAKYITAAEAAKELVWLHHLLTKLHEIIPGLTPLHIDNRATDLLAQNPMNHAATKHVDVCYHFIRECIADDLINLRLIGTNDMAADILMKSLANMKHKHFCLMLGMETLG